MSNKICTIKWNALNIAQWRQKFSKIENSNLLQSHPYAKTQRAVNRQSPRFGVIEINDAPAGLVQMLETSILKGALHTMIIDRGPLWFEGYGSLSDFEAFTKALAMQFPKRFGRRRRFIPEIENGPRVTEILKSNGFGAITAHPYETIVLDVQKPEVALRQGLKKNWCRTLKKAEKSLVEIEWDHNGKHLEWLLGQYRLDKAVKDYKGAPVPLIRALGNAFAAQGDLLIGRAIYKEKPIGAILILCHGKTATYQIGWSDSAGRDFGAHHLLLWNALYVLKTKNINNFDLGGVNENDAKGVKRFKAGMGGRSICLPGMYR